MAKIESLSAAEEKAAAESLRGKHKPRDSAEALENEAVKRNEESKRNEERLQELMISTQKREQESRKAKTLLDAEKKKLKDDKKRLKAENQRFSDSRPLPRPCSGILNKGSKITRRHLENGRYRVRGYKIYYSKR